jgi:hypothetical protein
MIEGTPALTEGTTIRLAFTLPGQRSSINTSGIVEGAVEHRSTVRFTNINRTDQLRIRELVEQSLR